MKQVHSLLHLVFFNHHITKTNKQTNNQHTQHQTRIERTMDVTGSPSQAGDTGQMPYIQITKLEKLCIYKLLKTVQALLCKKPFIKTMHVIPLTAALFHIESSMPRLCEINRTKVKANFFYKRLRLKPLLLIKIP